MRILLTILSGLGLLFSGGCLFWTGGMSAIFVVPVVALLGNIAVLSMLWRDKKLSTKDVKRIKAVAGLDFFLAIVMVGGVFLLPDLFKGPINQPSTVIYGALIAGLLAKGILTRVALDEIL